MMCQTLATFLDPAPLHTQSNGAAAIHAAAFYCPLDAVAAGELLLLLRDREVPCGHVYVAPFMFFHAVSQL